MINIVFFGTPDIGLKSLEHFYNSDKFNVQAVVTQPDKPSGRGHKLTPSPIKQFAVEHNIPVFQPKSIRKEPDIIEALKELKPDFFVTFAFGQILSQEVLKKNNLPDLQLDKILDEPELAEQIEVLLKEKVENEKSDNKEK